MTNPNNKPNLVRVDATNTRDGLNLLFRFRETYNTNTGEEPVKHIVDTEQTIEVTVGKGLLDAAEKLEAVAREIRVIHSGE